MTDKNSERQNETEERSDDASGVVSVKTEAEEQNSQGEAPTETRAMPESEKEVNSPEKESGGEIGFKADPAQMPETGGESGQEQGGESPEAQGEGRGRREEGGSGVSGGRGWESRDLDRRLKLERGGCLMSGSGCWRSRWRLRRRRCLSRYHCGRTATANVFNTICCSCSSSYRVGSG
jgi:hypothetical protein